MGEEIHEHTSQEFGNQDNDQVVPNIDRDPTDDLVVILAKLVLKCNKVVDFLRQETRSTRYFPNPFHIVNHRVEHQNGSNCLQIILEIENRPLDKPTSEVIGLILRYSYASVGIDERSIRQANSSEPRIKFKFSGFSIPIEIKMVSPNPAAFIVPF